MILVTGGTGIVGAHVLFELANSGLSVRALQRTTSDKKVVEDLFDFYSPNGKKLVESIEWFTGDILDVACLDDALKGCESVFHCAAMVSFNPADYNKLLESNEQGTANLVNACLSNEVSEFYYVSSVAAIGRNASTQTVDEETEWEPSKENSGYAVSKRNAEMEVWRAGEEGLKIAIVNPTIVLGPGRTSHSSGTLFKAVKNGQRYYTEGENGFIDARDVAFTLKRLYELKKFGERYVIVGENLSYRTVADTMAEYLEVSKPSIHAKPWLTSVVWRVLSITSKITRKNPVLTRESAKSSHRKTFYKNDKVRNELGVTFRTVEQSIKNASAFFSDFPEHL